MCFVTHKHFALPKVGGATRVAKCGGNIPKRKNSAAQLCEILRILTIYIVINCTGVQQHMRVTISSRYALSFVGRCFCFQFVFCHARSPECRAFEGCIVRTRIALPFIDFDAVCSVFFRRDCSFSQATQFVHSSLGGATIFAKLRSKIAKIQKIGGKVCAHHFVQIAEGFEKKFYRSSLGPGPQMCTYIIFFRMSLPSADSKCQIS